MLAQSHSEIEVLLIDDGSTDGSGDLCDRFAAADYRVRVIHRSNGGLSAARNSGLSAATGEYVCFLDGDDWIDRDTVRWLVNEVRDGTDLIVSGFHVDTEDMCGTTIKKETRLPSPIAIVKGCPSPEMRVDNQFIGLLGYAWNKLYRRMLLIENGLEFEEGLSLVEDVVFNRGVFAVANQVVFAEIAGVHYMQRPRMSLGTRLPPDLLDLRWRAMESVSDILRRYGVDDRAVRDIRSALALVALKGMAIADHPGGIGQAWSATRRMMKAPAYRNLVYSLPMARTLSAEDWVLVFALPMRLRSAHQCVTYSGHKWSPVVGRENVTPRRRSSDCQGKATRVRHNETRIRDTAAASTFTSLKRLSIRARLRLALLRARNDTSIRRGYQERRHVFVALAADYGNLGDLAITYAQIKFLKGAFPDSLIEPIPISRTLSAIKQLRQVIRDEDIITLVGGGNTGDMYDDIQYLRELYIANFSRNRIISFPQTIAFSESAYGRWAARRASRVYASHPDLTIMARDSSSYQRATSIFCSCRVVLAPDVVLTLDEVAPAGTREGVLLALRSDLERGLSSEDQQSVLSLEGVLGSLQGTRYAHWGRSTHRRRGEQRTGGILGPVSKCPRCGY